MSDFLLVIAIAAVAAFLTYLGVPLAERFDVPNRVVSAALQFAAGVLTAVVAFSLAPPAVQLGSFVSVVLAFFVGGAVFIAFEYYTAKRQAANPASGASAASLGFYAGILVDLFIDGMVIGIASSLTLEAGLRLALGLAISTAPLAFVTIATAKRQNVSKAMRQRLSILFVACVIGGAIASFVLLRNQPDTVRAVLIALACGFLLTTITQSMIPEANRDGEPSFAGVLFVGGIALYALLSFA